MVSSKGRELSSRIRWRSIDLSPLDLRPRTSRRQSSTTPSDISVEAEKVVSITNPGCSENLLSTDAEFLPPAPFSRPLLLACQVCLKGKDTIEKPVVSYCGHLFCWRCLLDRLPSEGPSHDQVVLPCPVCETTLCGRSRDIDANNIIPIFRKNGPVADYAEQPLPPPSSLPICILDEKVDLFHNLAQEFKCVEDRFNLMFDKTRHTRGSIIKGVEQITKGINKQLAISDNAKSTVSEKKPRHS